MTDGAMQLPEGVTLVGVIDPGDIEFDFANANLGTERGQQLLQASIEKYGAGRGIVLDKNNVDIAGNKTLREWLRQGKPVVIVETEGDVLVATRRRDWDIREDAEPREYATMDNRAGELNLSWDYERLVTLKEDPRINLDMGWKPIELEDIEAHLKPPSLGDLEDAWGEPEAEDFLNPLKLMLPQETIDRYYDLIVSLSGAPDEKFAKVLDWAEIGKNAAEA